MSSNLKVNSLVPATGTEIGIGTTGGSIDFRCPATFGGNVTIGGTLTYDEVINIDSIGIVTARSGLNVQAGQLDVGSNIKLGNAGVITATQFNGGSVTGTTGTFSDTVYITDNIQHVGDSNTQIRFPTNDQIQFETAGTSWFNLGSTGAFQIGNNSNAGAKVYIKNGNDDANNTNALALDIQGAWIRLGDAILGNETYSNGIGIKFHNSGVAHHSISAQGQDLYFSTTSNNGNQLWPSSRTDSLKLTGAGAAIFAGDITAGGNLYIPDRIYHVGDTNTQIRFPANDTITFETSGLERLRIDSSGHLKHTGIRSGNSENKLAILSAPSYNTSEEDVIIYQAENEVSSNQLSIGGGTSSRNAVTALSFRTAPAVNTTGGTERLRIKGDGKVLIGGSLGLGGATSSPGGLLHAQTSSGEALVKILGATNGVIQLSGYAGNSTINFGDNSSDTPGRLQYNHGSDSFHIRTGSNNRLHIMGNGDYGFNDSSPTANASGNDTVLSIKGKGSSYSGKIDFKDSSGNIDSSIASDNSIFMFNCDPNSQNGNTAMLFSVHGGERFRFGRHGQLGIAGANYGTARQVMVSNGSSSAVSWSSNPFLLDMDSLGDLDYDGVFLRYREVNVSGNGLVYLGLCKSTTNCPAGRIGCPVGFVPGVVYNSQFRVDKIGITPWPDTSGHRYEYFAIISDYVSSGKLGIFYLTNSTN